MGRLRDLEEVDGMRKDHLEILGGVNLHAEMMRDRREIRGGENIPNGTMEDHREATRNLLSGADGMKIGLHETLGGESLLDGMANGHQEALMQEIPDGDAMMTVRLAVLTRDVSSRDAIMLAHPKDLERETSRAGVPMLDLLEVSQQERREQKMQVASGAEAEF